MDSTKQILVVDIPANATAAEAEDLLNAPYENGYYIQSLTSGWAEIGARAFFKYRTREKQGEVAREVIAANVRQSVPVIRDALKKAGITRSTEWVRDAVDDFKGAGAR